MSFKSSYFIFTIFALITGFSELAFAQAQQAAPAGYTHAPGCANQACSCREYAKKAENNDCRNEPLKSDGSGNPLVTEADQKEIDEAKELIGSKGATASKICEANMKTAEEGLALLEEIRGVCAPLVEKCAYACGNASANANDRARCDEAKGLKSQLDSDIAQVTAQRDKAKACTEDVSGEGEEKKEEGGGSGFQMPQMPQKNPCEANPTSPQCQQLVQNCSNPSFASSNEVCKCFSSSGAGCSTTKQADPTEREGLSEGGGSNGYGGEGLDGDSSSGGPSNSKASGGSIASPGGGGSGGGSGSGANKAEAPALMNDPATVDANVLAGARTGAGGGAFGSGGSYSNDGNWIPPGMKNRKPADNDPALAAALTKRAQLCSPRNQPPRDNFKQINVRFICTFGLEPR